MGITEDYLLAPRPLSCNFLVGNQYRMVPLEDEYCQFLKAPVPIVLLTGLLFPYPLSPALLVLCVRTFVCELARQVQRPQTVESQGQSIA